MSKQGEEEKLRLFGLLASNPDTDLKILVQDLKVPITKLRRWKTEFLKLKDGDKLDTIITAEPVVLQKVAESVYSTVSKTKEEFIAEASQTNTDVTVIEPTVKPDSEVTAKVDRFINSVDNLKALQQSLQDTALKIIDTIRERLDEPPARGEVHDREIDEITGLPDMDDRLTTKDISNLTASLTAVQNAFFNRPTTNITVNNENSTGMLGEFRSRLSY